MIFWHFCVYSCTKQPQIDKLKHPYGIYSYSKFHHLVLVTRKFFDDGLKCSSIINEKYTFFGTFIH